GPGSSHDLRCRAPLQCRRQRALLPRDPSRLSCLASDPGGGTSEGGEPWYLLTNERVETTADAWNVVLAYARRWQIEMTFRNLKSELAIQSLRVYDWEGRLKLLGMLTLAYAFLMDLMREEGRTARDWLIDYVCHRSGAHLRAVE